MGLDAFVRCNCFWEGKTSEPPVPRELVHVDEDGWWGLITDWREWGENEWKLDEWLETACAHPQMHWCDEWVCSIGGKGYFLSALRRAGIEHFSVLWERFPKGNGGQLSPQNAALGLEELGFLQEDELIKDEGSFAFGSGQSVVLNEQGLLVLEGQEKVLFAARRIKQIALDEKHFRWTNLGTGETLDTLWNLSITTRWPDGNWQNEQGKRNIRLVETARWRKRPMTPLDLDYIIAPMTRLFKASVEIGNPVVWC